MDANHSIDKEHLQRSPYVHQGRAHEVEGQITN